jgi:membrane-bound lytic murein transglycosylase D
MEIHHKSFSAKIFICSIIILICSSCGINRSYLKDDKKSPLEKKALIESDSAPSRKLPEQKTSSPDKMEGKGDPPLTKSAENKTISQATEDQKKEKIRYPDKIAEKEAPPLTQTAENKTTSPQASKKQEKSDQQKLDLALEFCQASNDFWDQGDLDNSLDALDHAYSLILKVNPDHNPKILQQKEDLRFTISKRIIEVYSSRFKVANGYHKAIPLVMNRHVARAIKLFEEKGRDYFINAYHLSGRYRPAIVKALKEAGLPEELSWLPLIESGFNVRALSRARALGLWQFIASTGYKFGLKRNYWIDERMDPEKSTKAAIDYLKELHQIFGDWTTALAAYNCGEGMVLKAIRTQKINYLDHFWDLYAKLPIETAFYVPKFLAILHILNDPEAHGFILPPMEQEIKTDVVTVAKQVHLKTMSKYLGISYGVLKDLNPALRRNCTPPNPYAFKVPEGKGALLLSKLDDMPVWRPPTPAYVIHKVRKGESLSIIAHRYRTSIRAIMALNGLKSAHFIKAGWKLKIPTRRI